MDKNMVLLSKDLAYIRSLSDYICNSHLISYRIITFVDIYDYFLFKQEEHVDILLIDEIMIDDCINELPEFYLTLTRKNTDNTSEIFMYQNMEMIVKQLSMNLYCGDNNSDEVNSCNIFTIVNDSMDFYSPYIGYALAEAFGERNKTLYISFDPYVSGFLGEKDCLSEFIYNLKIHREMCMVFSNKFIMHGQNCDYIAGTGCFYDVLNIDSDLISSFISGVCFDGKYKNIVIDLGMMFTGSQMIISKSNKIIIFEKNEERSDIIVNQLIRVSGESIRDKIVRYNAYEGNSVLSGTSSELRGTKIYAWAREVCEKLINHTFALKTNDAGDDKKYPQMGGLTKLIGNSMK